MTSLFLILIVTVILNCIRLNKISSRMGVPALLAFITAGGEALLQAGDRLVILKLSFAGQSYPVSRKLPLSQL